MSTSRRLKFNSKTDLSIGFHLDRFESIINAYNPSFIPKNINDVLELFQAKLFVDNNVFRIGTSKETEEEYRLKVKTIPSIIARFFKSRTSEQLVEDYKMLDQAYCDCFWDIQDKYGINIINDSGLKDILAFNKYCIRDILHYKKTVEKHEKFITSYNVP